jgi:cytochrome c oxidase subunit 3
MEIGTVETDLTLEKEEKEKRRRSSFRGSRGGPGNGGGGGNDDGGGHEEPKPKKNPIMPDENNPEKSKILTWFLLLVVLMTFGGLIGAYVVVATNGALEWRPFSLPPQVWVSTVIILASSVTYHFGKSNLWKRKPETSKKWFMGTTILGAAFISSQILAWMALVERGMYMRGNPYAGFFYVLTAVHAVHVAGGIAALGYIVMRTWNDGRLPEDQREKNRNESVVIGWYWHTMDGLWLVLLFFLGFWK